MLVARVKICVLALLVAGKWRVLEVGLHELPYQRLLKNILIAYFLLGKKSKLFAKANQIAENKPKVGRPRKKTWMRRPLDFPGGLMLAKTLGKED